jgi:hypothetical protein
MTDDGHILDRDLERLILGTITDETELAPLESASWCVQIASNGPKLPMQGDADGP